jgi:DMSO/TMAO reductase YedYZ molybdopterin-dependent catalytic subunit
MAEHGHEVGGALALNRRDFLRDTALATMPLVLSAAGELSGQVQAAGGSPGSDPPKVRPLIAREKDPENLEFPFSSLSQSIIPNDRFYVRNHFAVPKLDVKTWRLRVEGAVKKPFELDHAALRKMKPSTLIALLECAGNGRGFLVPKARGVPWQLGAVGNAEWTGVPLAAVLDRAGLRDGAVDVVLEGADSGSVAAAGGPPGTIHFARSLPLTKAKRPEVLLAYRMNGADLPAAHGFPLRAVVGGWYGMASIKWLKRIVVTDRAFNGYFQSMDYSYYERRDGLPVVAPITEMQVKAQIARPSAQEVVPLKKAYRIHGAAWAGESNVTRVEVSTDAGKTWAQAKLLGKEVPLSWRLWEFSWTPAKAGRATLMARATDARGRTQPMQRDPDRRNYMVSHVLPTQVEVK